jgi:hypothetical protein
MWQSWLMPKGCPIIDASSISVLKTRNIRADNRQIKEGKMPEGASDQLNMKRRRTRIFAGPRSAATTNTSTSTKHKC